MLFFVNCTPKNISIIVPLLEISVCVLFSVQVRDQMDKDYMTFRQERQVAFGLTTSVFVVDLANNDGKNSSKYPFQTIFPSKT
jgi:hypothetical protein